MSRNTTLIVRKQQFCCVFMLQYLGDTVCSKGPNFSIRTQFLCSIPTFSVSSKGCGYLTISLDMAKEA